MSKQLEYFFQILVIEYQRQIITAMERTACFSPHLCSVITFEPIMIYTCSTTQNDRQNFSFVKDAYVDGKKLTRNGRKMATYYAASFLPHYRRVLFSHLLVFNLWLHFVLIECLFKQIRHTSQNNYINCLFMATVRTLPSALACIASLPFRSSR